MLYLIWSDIAKRYLCFVCLLVFFYPWLADRLHNFERTQSWENTRNGLIKLYMPFLLRILSCLVSTVQSINPLKQTHITRRQKQQWKWLCTRYISPQHCACNKLIYHTFAINFSCIYVHSVTCHTTTNYQSDTHTWIIILICDWILETQIKSCRIQQGRLFNFYCTDILFCKVI